MGTTHNRPSFMTDDVEFVDRLPQIYKLDEEKKERKPVKTEQLNTQEAVIKREKTKKRFYRTITKRLRLRIQNEQKRDNLTDHWMASLIWIAIHTFRKAKSQEKARISIEAFNKILDFLKIKQHKIMGKKYNPLWKKVYVTSGQSKEKKMFKAQNTKIKEIIIGDNYVDIEEAKKLVELWQFKTVKRALRHIKHTKQAKFYIFKEKEKNGWKLKIQSSS